jgi:hypothetical protein
MFDEQSVTEHLYFNHNFGYAEGFENHGSQGRTCKTANCLSAFRSAASMESGNSQELSILVMEALR